MDLSKVEICRYSRQLLLPELGISGQKKLKEASVLIVGAGGLGCPAAIYLAAAGIGRLGLVDYDAVELNNLHRQVLHTESGVGCSKAHSAATSCQNLNSHVECTPINTSIDSSNALKIMKNYDVILDCTDNVATRYLLNDASVLLNKPLVSGSALRFEGQLTVYHHAGGPCYRCLFPQPPPPETVTNCSDGGVLGVVPGIIGSMQALECLKLIAGIGESLSGQLLLFDALNCSWRRVRIRERDRKCSVCGDTPTVTQLIDYTQFCGAAAHDKEQSQVCLPSSDRLSPLALKEQLQSSDAPPLLLDVRQPHELDICSLPNSINVQLRHIQRARSLSELPQLLVQSLRDYADDDSPNNSVGVDSSEPLSLGTAHRDSQLSSRRRVVVLCRRGNDSQQAVLALRRLLQNQGISATSARLTDLAGGLHAWARDVNPKMPAY